jgi:putative acyl-CoA dehydrogenase
MPPHLGDQDLWQGDLVLREGVAREGGGWAADKLAAFGKIVGAAEIFEAADLANKHPPELKPFDRYGMRVNQVEFHPAYHDLMAVAIENQVPSFAWNNPQPGAQVAHAALTYMFNQPEGGVLCPMAMTYAAIPPLRTTRAVGDGWIPRLLSTSYDRRDIPAEQNTGATIGLYGCGPVMFPGPALDAGRGTQQPGYPAPEGQARQPLQRLLGNGIPGYLGCAGR